MSGSGDYPCPDPVALFERAREQVSCALFWKGRDEEAVWMSFGSAGNFGSLGECRAALKRIAHDSAPFAPRAFCAVPFDRDFQTASPWESFPSRLYVVPQVVVRWRNGSASLLCLPPGEKSQAWHRMLSENHEEAPRPHTRSAPRTQRGEWRGMVKEVMPGLERGALRKVVLARSVSAFADKPIPASAVLTGLLAQEGCSVFAFGSGNDVFMGASPERLFTLEKDRLTTESLAGTRARGRIEAEDRSLAGALAGSEKERREHEIVREFIVARLKTLCTTHEADPPSVRKLDTVQHLYTTLRGRLREGVGPDEVLEALHPTPAVCGDPREAARELIRRLEATPRGYYAGAIGWIDSAQAEMAVAIRCGLIKGKRAIVFAGAGIVAGSDPDAEWDETENKMRPCLRALGGVDS